MDIDVEVFFDSKEGMLVLEGKDWSKVTLSIGKKQYPVTSQEMDLKTLGLRDGEYYVQVYYDGDDGFISLWGGVLSNDENGILGFDYFLRRR